MIDTVARLQRVRKNGEDEGFTLIELLVVVVIIGILIAIAVPLYLNYQKSSNDKAAQSDVRNAISVLETCNSDNGSYPASVTGLPTAAGDAGSVDACTNQKVTWSKNSTMYYDAVTNGYRLYSKNTGGSGKVYCYLSTSGGSVKSLSAAPATAGAC